MLTGGSWVGATAAEIARAVQRGDTTATAVVADHLDHVRIVERIVNPIRVLREAAAIAEAEQVDELPDLANLPLAGVPVLVQESIPVAGLPRWHGSAEARTAVAQHDHEVVRRLRGAGAIVLGLGRMSELGLWVTTDDASGMTRNPWRTDRTAGGAAGGPAAAVASGAVPIACGDGLITVPAACCGVVGFQPVPNQGLGVLASSVGDVARALAVLSGRDPAPTRAPTRAPTPLRARVAVSLRSPIRGPAPDAAAHAAVAVAARLLLACGHDAVRADGPRYPARLALSGAASWFAFAAREADSVREAQAGVVLQRRTRRHAVVGSWAARRHLVRRGGRMDWADQCREWFAGAGADVILAPALPGPPPAAEPARQWSARSWMANAATVVSLTAFTAPYAFAGLPAVTLPVGVRPDGLPASVLLVGPPGSEPVLLAVAAQLELAARWRRHAPTWPRRQTSRHVGAGHGAGRPAARPEPARRAAGLPRGCCPAVGDRPDPASARPDPAWTVAAPAPG